MVAGGDGGGAAGAIVGVLILLIIVAVVWWVAGAKKCTANADCTVWPFKTCGTAGKCTLSTGSSSGGGSGSGSGGGGDSGTGTCTPNPCVNGGTCSGAGICSCPPGFIGNTCQYADPCNPNNPCKNGGTCTSDSSDGSYTCQCPSGWTGPTCQTGTGCNLGGSGLTSTAWCIGSTANTNTNPSTCSAAGVCIDCGAPYALAPNGSCTACADPTATYDPASQTCVPPGGNQCRTDQDCYGSDVPVDGVAPGSCNDGVCTCNAPYALNSTSNTCSACTSGNVMMNYLNSQGQAPGNICVPSVTACALCAPNGCACDDSLEPVCPPNQYYLFMASSAHEMLGAPFPGPGCYVPSPTPAQAVTTDCYPAADSDYWEEWNAAGGPDQACKCEFGPDASWAAHVPQSEGTSYCAATPGGSREQTNVYACNVPFPVLASTPTASPPVNQWQNNSYTTDRPGYGQAGIELNDNPGQAASCAGKVCDYSVWTSDGSEPPLNRCQDTSSGGPYAPGWGWYSPATSWWQGGGPMGPPTNLFSPSSDS